MQERTITYYLLNILKTIVRSFLLLVIIVIAMVIAMYFLLYSDHNKINIGMSRTEVIELVGAPRWEDDKLQLCGGNSTWTGDCEKALQSVSEKWLVWKNGPDLFFVVGLDASNKVVWSGSGTN